MIRPTVRTRNLVIAALLLYFFANQTQIGWLYVMSALLLGIVAAAWLVSLGMLGRVEGERSLSADEIYEGDQVTVSLRLAQRRAAPALQIRSVEVCPLADPRSPQHHIDLFIPQIPGSGAVAFSYETPAYRRGVQRFEPLTLTTGAPFGLFRGERKIDVPTAALVYPEVIRLRQLSLLDRQPAAQQTRPRAGHGSEVIGVRPFRPGDSPRHVHWRTVARTQQLISKEFADEAHPGLTLALDLFRHPYPHATTKHTPFEWSIKAAAAIAEYARRRGYALHLAADQDALPAPAGPLSWEALMQLLARAEPAGSMRLADLLPSQSYQTFVAVMIPWPEQDALTPQLDLKGRGLDVLAVVLDPASFPDGGPASGPLVDGLRAAGIEAALVQFGKDLGEQIAETPERVMADVTV